MGKFHFTFKRKSIIFVVNLVLKITPLSKKIINATIIIVLVLKITYLEKNKQIIKKFYNSNR